MTGRDVVVVGASAGGVEALRALVAGLPADLPAAVLVVLHVPAQGGSVLPSILGRVTPLDVAHAVDGEPLVNGRVYVAPPDHHLLVGDGLVRVARGPRENGHRPAADPLFRSAAYSSGARVIAVVLSGALDDGTAGLAAVVARGGVTVVQDPDDALHASMPRSALDNVRVDHVRPAAQLGGLVAELARERLPELPGVGGSAEMRQEVAMASLELGALNDPERPGVPAGFGCPECSGALFEISDTQVVHYRCRVGHAWSPESLLAEQGTSLEGALWMALRSLEDKAALCDRLAAPARSRGQDRLAQRYAETAHEAHLAARLIRDMLLRRPAENAAKSAVSGAGGA